MVGPTGQQNNAECDRRNKEPLRLENQTRHVEKTENTFIRIKLSFVMMNGNRKYSVANIHKLISPLLTQRGCFNILILLPHKWHIKFLKSCRIIGFPKKSNLCKKPSWILGEIFVLKKNNNEIRAILRHGFTHICPQCPAILEEYETHGKFTAWIIMLKKK